MIREGHLSDSVLQTLATTTDLSELKLVKGNFAMGELSRVLNDDFRNDLIVRAWQNVS
ncbi:hypothetical protein GGF31_005540 [Allomyces arbusculus]|nr:hypothetical protein GGF31_005540 [Allomyces arbusculus]